MPENKDSSGPDTERKGKDSSPVEARYKNVKPEYVDYVLKMSIDSKMGENTAYKEDRSRFPVVVTDGYYSKTATGQVNVTIKGVVYTVSQDFDYEYCFHSELNEVSGNGFDMIKEILHFKNLPGNPTLTGLAVVKSSSVIYSPKADLSHAENVGNYQLVGSGIFKDVVGSGIAMFGRSTDNIVYHIAWIKGWPL